MSIKRSSLAKALRRRSESGFTLVEMVVAIPIVTLILGLLITTIGVTSSLMADVSVQSSAAKEVTTTSEELSDVRNCAALNATMNRINNQTLADKDFNIRVAAPVGYSCVKNSMVTLTVSAVSKTDNTATKYSSKVGVAID